jgi:putative CocE/NonD family hydrolase
MPLLNYSRLDAAPVDPRADEVMVEARDGVRLATDIYMPEHGDRHPAVLVRLPYDKSGRYTFMPQIAPMFTDRGYAFVVQDVAGKFRSGGETVPYVREIEDGYDAIEWIVGQRWSNGTVGMWGDSYYGFTQWAAVESRHPALRAIVPRVTSADLADMRLGTCAVLDRLHHGSVDRVVHTEVVTVDDQHPCVRRETQQLTRQSIHDAHTTQLPTAQVLSWARLSPLTRWNQESSIAARHPRTSLVCQLGVLITP